jgi:hypothetical protein
VSYTVSFSLGTPHSNVILHDIFSGGGAMAPATDLAGTVVLNGPGIVNQVVSPVRTANVVSRIEYDLPLGNLGAGSYVLTVAWHFGTDLQCYENGKNTVHLNYDNTRINWNTSTASWRMCQ